MTKRVLAFFLFLATFGVPSFADEKKPSEVLEELRLDIEATFEESLGAAYHLSHHFYLAARVGDFNFALRNLLLSQLSSMGRLRDVSNAISTLKSNGFSEEELLDTHWMLFSLARIQRELGAQDKAWDSLRNAWDERCHESRLKSFTDPFDPLAMFPQDGMKFPLTDTTPYMQFSISPTVSSGGQYEGSSASFYTQDETTAAIVGGATGVGAAVGSCVVPVVGTAVGAAIGFVVGSLVAAVVGGIKAHKENKKQLDVIEKIRVFVNGRIESLSENRVSLVRSSCEKVFASNKIVKDSFETRVDELQQFGRLLHKQNQSILTFLEAEFEKLPNDYASNIEQLRKGYLNKLPHLYAQIQEDHFEGLLRMDEDCLLFYRDRVEPLLGSLKKASSRLEILEAKNSLVATRLEGDALFLRMDADTLLPKERVGLWNEVRDAITKAVQK